MLNKREIVSQNEWDSWRMKVATIWSTMFETSNTVSKCWTSIKELEKFGLEAASEARQLELRISNYKTKVETARSKVSRYRKKLADANKKLEQRRPRQADNEPAFRNVSGVD
jgi:phage shock protein A